MQKLSDILSKKPKGNPTIYAYKDTNPQYKGLLKVGYTSIDVFSRVRQQYPTKRPGPDPFKIVLEESAMLSSGSNFTDRDVHKILRKMDIPNPDGEWFKCDAEDIQSAIIQLRTGKSFSRERNKDFKMRPEQIDAVQKTELYFNSFKNEKGKVPKMLWNAKMRFGKTFAAYQLAKKMKWKKVLVLTFKPAVQSAWQEDLETHIDFDGWQFVAKANALEVKDIDKDRPIVCFGSFQDYLGKNKIGGIKTKNEWVHTTHWDAVIFDEYHYGAWRENAKDLFQSEDDRKEKKIAEGNVEQFVDKETGQFDTELMPITTNHYLFLSGTPFRALTSGEFIEEQIFNWTYSDEQRAKEQWIGEDNPYKALPKMVMMTYQLPDSVKNIAMQGEFNEFDLNVFFSASGKKDEAKFKYEDEVQKWLDLIRGAHLPTSVDNLKLGSKKPPMPYHDSTLLSVLNHTFWFMPSVASCHAMKNLLAKRNNIFYHDYKVLVVAGTDAGVGLKALPPVEQAMNKPLESKTITLSCGKLTTGVTVKPWSGIFMLRNLSSPETYFQAAFRVQSGWAISNQDGSHPSKNDIIKPECYIFDFAINRALKLVGDYAMKLNVEDVSNNNPEESVGEFIRFLPILAYDGTGMKQIDAAGVLSIALSGTSATMLARRWESAQLVNVDNETLARILANEDALKALENIEGFRNLNQDIETIINKSENVKKAKKELDEDQITPKKRKELSEEEKEYKSKRKQVQEKLIKFATRVPIFMYLTDFREYTLKDVITKIEPELFRKVTGLRVKDFDLLVSLGVFNSQLMNEAVWNFKRYEDASLAYTGINMHQDTVKLGGFDTVVDKEEILISD